MNSLKKIIELREEIKKHDRLYEENRPIISDGEYDALFQELVELEKKYPEYRSDDSPTNRIYTKMIDELEKVKHRTFMGSQEKTTTWEGVVNFIRRSNDEVLLQYKLDGLTIVLTYNHGKLQKAVTRGTGEEGELVTHTVQTIRNVPKEIDFDGELEVRMEAIIPYKEFERINVDGQYSNPRNLASGTIRQLDASIAKKRNLQGIVFDAVYIEGKTFEKDEEQLNFLKNLGFTVVETKKFNINQLNQLKEEIDQIENQVRTTLPYMIDGLVLKFNDLSLREELGSTAKHPRWAIAYKFASLEARTTILGYTLQVGRTGQITPVAELKPVNIDGVTISRATLHNFDNIAEKDIRVGDTVIVIRANDVIPKVTTVLKEYRNGTEKRIEIPSHCPVCNSPTQKDGAILYCTGVDCEPQLINRIEHFASRKALNIEGLGIKVIDQFYKMGYIKHFLDLYRLEEKKEEILSIKGYGTKKFERLMEELEKAKTAPLHQVLFGLSIPLLGEDKAKELSKTFSSMDEILKNSKNKDAFKEKLLQIKNFGEEISESVSSFFANKRNREIIESLQQIGYTMLSFYTQSEQDDSFKPLEGKTFVITGTLSDSRDVFKEKIEKFGGKVTGSVSKKTDFLLMGEDAQGTSKHQKALSLKIPIISETEFIKMIS